MAERLLLDVLPPGAVRNLDDAARVIEEVSDRCDAAAALADLGVVGPGLVLLDSARLLRSVAGYMRAPGRPLRWTSEMGGHDELLQTLLTASSRMVDEGEAVVGLNTRTLRTMLLDLAATLRGADG